MGTTIAELGNMNRPLDMIAYKKDGADYILMANSNRGVMKLDASNLGKYGATFSRDRGHRGDALRDHRSLQGVRRLDRFDENSALAMVATGEVLNPTPPSPCLERSGGIAAHHQGRRELPRRALERA